jgi:hypothetical protein
MISFIGLYRSIVYPLYPETSAMEAMKLVNPYDNSKDAIKRNENKNSVA